MVPCIIPLPVDCRSAIKKAKNREFLWFGIVGEHNGRGRHVARVLDAGEPNMGETDNIEERLDNPLDTGIIWSGVVDLIDETFPDYLKAIPERRALRGISAFLDHKRLADFGVVAGDLMRKGPAPLRMFSSGEGEPVMVECARRDFVGVIMPMREDVLGIVVSGEFAEPPAWAQREPQPEVFAKEAVRA
jgi:hypothetical protein